MKAKTLKEIGYGLGCFLAVLIFVGVCTLSWIATCGIVWLVAACFGFEFSWGIGTGVWVIAIFISSLFNGKK